MLYGLNRLSEDIGLDNQIQIDLSKLNDDLKAYFSHMFLYDQVTLKEQHSTCSIYRLTLKFSILKNLGLSPTSSEALHFKLEISQRTQVAEIERTPSLLTAAVLSPHTFQTKP